MGHTLVLGFYLALNVIAPALVLGWGFTSLVYESHYPSLSWSAGVGLLVYLITGVVFTVRFFPVSPRRGLTLLVPLIVNGTFFFLADLSPESLPLMAFILSTGIFAGQILTIAVSFMIHPWIETGGDATARETVAAKYLYLKKNPGVFAGLLLLILPILSAVYFALTGIDFFMDLTSWLLPGWAAVLYGISVLNVAFFHYREFSKYFTVELRDNT